MPESRTLARALLVGALGSHPLGAQARATDG
jgi:hypothetical protein